MIAAPLVGFDVPARPGALDPPDRGRHANPEPLRRSSARRTGFYGFDNPAAQINRQGFGHEGWPPSPALILNHNPTNLGISHDSKTTQNALDVLVRIVIDGLESISNRFRGPNDPFWSMAREAISDAFEGISQQPDGMTPFQQRLAILIIKCLQDNMNGWYPTISRVVLTTFGPYRENARQLNATAYNIVKDAAYIELKKLPELAREHPEKLADYFPDNIAYDVVGNRLTHTYSDGNIAVTELTQLQIDPIDFADKALRRPLTDDERNKAEWQIY